MLQVKRGVRSEEVRAGAQHVLFVEGSEGGSLDQAVLRALLHGELRIETMGPSFWGLSRLVDKAQYGWVRRAWRPQHMVGCQPMRIIPFVFGEERCPGTGCASSKVLFSD